MDTSTINFYKGNHKYEVSADELATEIAQCLQIENLNFLIGAGCSSYRDDTGAEKAIPTMAGLAREFYDCNPDLKVDRKNAAKDLFPNNLEALINYLISLKNITTSEKAGKLYLGKLVSLISSYLKECAIHHILKNLFSYTKSFTCALSRKPGRYQLTFLRRITICTVKMHLMNWALCTTTVFGKRSTNL